MKAYLLCAGILVSAAPSIAQTSNFDSDMIGKAPGGWTCGVTGAGTPHWVVTADPSAPSPPNVLLQNGTGTFPWCVSDKVNATDGSVEVQFKPISGKDDQAGGVVWRFRDANNYYVARANALENNVSLYYTVNGSRKTIQYVNAPVKANAWHVLRVSFKDDMIDVVLDGKTYISTKDRHLTGPGKVGVWTKADSVTAFDNFLFKEP